MIQVNFYFILHVLVVITSKVRAESGGESETMRCGIPIPFH